MDGLHHTEGNPMAGRILEAAHFMLGNTVLIHLPNDVEAGLCMGGKHSSKARKVLILSSRARLTGYGPWSSHLQLCALGWDSNGACLGATGS